METYLAAFSGLVCDKGLSLGDLIGTLHQFFSRLGLKQLRLKPAYNPYTEPSMEIFRCFPYSFGWYLLWFHKTLTFVSERATIRRSDSHQYQRSLESILSYVLGCLDTEVSVF